MYNAFFGFREKPFEITPDPTFFFESEIHKEALARLRYAIYEGKGFSVITGEAGTGKTTLVHTLLESLDGQVRTSFIFNPALDRADFLSYVCDDLEVRLEGVKTPGQSLMALHNFLLDCFARDEKVFLIIDEAQSMQPELLQEVRLLTNLETSRSKLLHVILLGQPELDRRLAEPAFRPLKQRIVVRYHLRPLRFRETRQYIQSRLKMAGARNMTIFDRGAVKAIYHYSKGIPRLINILCDNALLTGFARDTTRIDKAIIGDLVDELEGSKQGEGRARGLTALLFVLLLTLLLGAIVLVFQEAFSEMILHVMEIFGYGQNV